MTITYRAEKGSPLTSEEVDNNFRELETHLKVLDDHCDRAEGIGKIHVEGEQITFRGTFGTDFGTFTLPKSYLNPCGPWHSQTPYKKLDLVTTENALYCCLANHISNVWSQDYSFWKLILTIPQPPQMALPLYEKATLPGTEALGKIAVLMETEEPTLIFFNGKNWQILQKGENL